MVWLLPLAVLALVAAAASFPAPAALWRRPQPLQNNPHDPKRRPSLLLVLLRAVASLFSPRDPAAALLLPAPPQQILLNAQPSGQNSLPFPSLDQPNPASGVSAYPPRAPPPGPPPYVPGWADVWPGPSLYNYSFTAGRKGSLDRHAPVHYERVEVPHIDPISEDLNEEIDLPDLTHTSDADLLCAALNALALDEGGLSLGDAARALSRPFIAPKPKPAFELNAPTQGPYNNINTPAYADTTHPSGVIALPAAPLHTLPPPVRARPVALSGFDNAQSVIVGSNKPKSKSATSRAKAKSISPVKPPLPATAQTSPPAVTAAAAPTPSAAPPPAARIIPPVTAFSFRSDTLNGAPSSFGLLSPQVGVDRPSSLSVERSSSPPSSSSVSASCSASTPTPIPLRPTSESEPSPELDSHSSSVSPSASASTSCSPPPHHVEFAEASAWPRPSASAPHHDSSLASTPTTPIIAKSSFSFNKGPSGASSLPASLSTPVATTWGWEWEWDAWGWEDVGAGDGDTDAESVWGPSHADSAWAESTWHAPAWTDPGWGDAAPTYAYDPPPAPFPLALSLALTPAPAPKYAYIDPSPFCLRAPTGGGSGKAAFGVSVGVGGFDLRGGGGDFTGVGAGGAKRWGLEWC
ncbi:hypothetical protein C8J57DRAFT_1726451 [Mycena rebaudengoi]|nr:hypothetical protein C8J57DRAFT_1726451 [Mycena rebaudengoi]